ncbi:MAG: hypothetical protein CMA15_01730 [Euryarchaeota archaeon]|nr:hypothetical protein [Euryarchaeota archaeon]
MQTEDLNKQMCKVIGTRVNDSPSRAPLSGCLPHHAQVLATTTPNREALHYPMNQVARTSISIDDGGIASLERENSGFSM